MAVAAVVAVTLLGNLRLQASELQAQQTSASGDAADHASSTRGMQAHRSRARPVAPLMDAGDLGIVDDDAHLVPAIYAWDPDVRFVYFRHISKWM